MAIWIFDIQSSIVDLQFSPGLRPLALCQKLWDRSPDRELALEGQDPFTCDFPLAYVLIPRLESGPTNLRDCYITY